MPLEIILQVLAIVRIKGHGYLRYTTNDSREDERIPSQIRGALLKIADEVLGLSIR
jgi:hypothetical protein